jgi:hypothetical protein
MSKWLWPSHATLRAIAAFATNVIRRLRAQDSLAVSYSYLVTIISPTELYTWRSYWIHHTRALSSLALGWRLPESLAPAGRWDVFLLAYS